MGTKSLFKKGVNLVTLLSFLVWNLAAATPEGGSVAAGSAAITQSGTTTTINQSSQNAVINWQGFNTAANEKVQFNQPGPSAIALNRINSGLPTTFNGSLSANGQVWIVNPNGIVFGTGSTVNVAGLLATTHGIANADFMAGNYHFVLDPNYINSQVINNGTITIADNGIAALVAPTVANNGTIIANYGKVSLSTGSEFVLDLYGDSLINFGTSAPISKGSVSNTGLIQATGGKVYMTANTAAGVLDNVISMSGAIVATTASTGAHGTIILNGGHAGRVKVSGKLDASNGGYIETSGYIVDLDPALILNAGPGGTWSMDPNNIFLTAGPTCSNPAACSTNYVATGDPSTVGVDFIQSQLSVGTSVTITASGNIRLTVPFALGGPFTVVPPPTQPELTLNAGGDIFLDQPLTNASGSSHIYLTLHAGQVITTGSIFINADITLPNTGGITGGLLQFTAGTAGAIYVNTPNITAGAVQLVNGQEAFGFIFNSPVILQQNVTFSSPLSHSIFNSTINNCTGGSCTIISGVGPFSLTIGPATGLIDFGGNVGGVAPLASIAVNNGAMRITGATTFTTIGDQFYNPQVFFFSPPSVTFVGQNPGALVTLNGGVETNNTGGFVQVGNATYTTDALIRSTVSGFVNTSTVTVYGTTVLDGATIITSGTQDYKQAVTVTSNNTVLNSNGLVLFEDLVDGPGSLTTNANNTQFNSVAAGGTQFSAFNINNTMTLNGGSIDQNAVTYNFPVIVTALNGTMNGAGLIAFNSTLTGAGLLTINDGSGNVQFNGSTVNLGALTVTGPTSISTSTMQTSNDQIYNSAVTLVGASTAINSSSGNIIFGGTVDGTSIGAQSLTVNAAGTVTFDGIVGGTPLSSLDVTGSQININTSGMSTSGDQNYHSPVFINNVGPITFTTSTGTIIFNSPVASTGTPAKITITGNLTIGNSSSIGIGVGNDVSSLYVSGTTRDGGNITTTGDPTFVGPYILTNDVIINDASLAGITFGSTVDSDAFGPWSLTLNATNGPVTFNGAVGGTPLRFLDVTATVININAGSISTTLTQFYHSPVLLISDTTLNSTNAVGNITFASTLDGGVNFVVNSNAVTQFNGIVGGTPLTSIDIASPNVAFLTGATSVTTTGAQLYEGSAATVNVGSSTMNFNGGSVRFGLSPGAVLGLSSPTIIKSTAGNSVFQDINGPSSLTVSSSGTTVFRGDIGLGTALLSLSVVPSPGTGTTLFDYNEGFLQTVVTTGSQIYTDTVTLGTGGFANDIQMFSPDMLFTSDPGPLGTNLISFGSGTHGVQGLTSALTVITNNPANGPTGRGVTGTVHVKSLTLGGSGGANISSFAVQDSTVNGAGGQQARTNTTAPANVAGVVIYCVNGFNCQPAPVPPTPPVPPAPPIPLENTTPNNIPQTEIFNFTSGLYSCNAEGCTNLEIVNDNLVESGVVSCAGNGCPYGFIEAHDMNGRTRILMPGDIVYAGDTLYKDRNSCVCVKGVSGKRECYGPGQTKIVYDK